MKQYSCRESNVLAVSALKRANREYSLLSRTENWSGVY